MYLVVADSKPNFSNTSLWALMNGGVFPKKIMETGMNNWTLMLRLSKLEQWEKMLVVITDHPSVPV